MKNYNNKNVVEVVVYRDTIEEHEYNSNLSFVTVAKDFMEKYFEECVKSDYEEEYGKYLTANKWYNEIYTADDTEDFYEYAKKHNAILNVEHDDMDGQLEREICYLKNVGDCFGYSFGNGKGVLVEVGDYGNGLEYLIERSNVVDGIYEPYGDENEFCDFGNKDRCLEIIINIYNEQ